MRNGCLPVPENMFLIFKKVFSNTDIIDYKLDIKVAICVTK